MSAIENQPGSMPAPPGPVDDPRMVARLLVINEVSAAALRHPSAAEVFRVAAESIVRHFSYFQASVFEVRPVDRRVVLVAQSPPVEALGESPYSQAVDAGVIGAVVRERASVVVSDARTDPRYVAPPGRAVACASELCAPVLKDGAVAAVIDVEAREPGSFGESDRLALEAIANVVALVLHAAEVHAALEQQCEQLRAAQCQLLDTERLADVGRLTSRVAHEIRNPLTTIGGFARRVARHPGSDATTRRYGAIIVSEVDRLERLLGGIMSFVNPGLPRKAPVDINALLRRSIDLCRADVQGKHIACEKHLDPDLPRIMADPAQIEQVLVHIIRNAAESIADEGTVTIVSQRAGDDVVIRVSDTGRGIPPEQLANVFDPFFTTKAGGTGLGLAVASKVVDDHGGHILIGSEVGKGTHVNIRLPIGKPEDQGT